MAGSYRRHCAVLIGPACTVFVATRLGGVRLAVFSAVAGHLSDRIARPRIMLATACLFAIAADRGFLWIRGLSATVLAGVRGSVVRLPVVHDLTHACFVARMNALPRERGVSVLVRRRALHDKVPILRHIPIS
jgi:hypothetical protein